MKLFIPFGGREDWGEELKYALRSLMQFEKFDLTIYSTKFPSWITGCEAIDIERFYPVKAMKMYGFRKFEQWFDSMNKLRTFAKNTNEERFIYTYDDILLLKPASPKDIIHYPQERVIPRHYVIFSKSRHGETILSALRKCDKAVLYNYETHTPRVYETDKLLFLFRMFPLEKEFVPYSVATLYFNYFGNVLDKELIGIDDYKAGFYGKPSGNGFLPNSLDDVDVAIKGKTWLNYSNAGLMRRNDDGTPILMEWIKQRFRKKSIYERT